jgi:phosphate transport system protein
MTKHLEREVEKLKQRILGLSAIVEDSVYKAVKSVEERDPALADSVVEADHIIDTLEVEVEEDCLKVLALHQPVAKDLRLVVAVLKINNDLERIGDLAVNIAQRSKSLSLLKKVSALFQFSHMSAKVKQMLRQSLQALVNLDRDLAVAVCAADDEVDTMNRDMHKQIRESIGKHPEDLEALLYFISVSRNLERIADHATNIAEDVIYMIDGEIVRHKVASQVK